MSTGAPEHASEPEGAIDEDARRRFEAALRAGEPARAEAFAPAARDPRRGATLVELACIELEHRWRAAVPGAPPPAAEELLARFPELREPAAAAELFVEELRAALTVGADAPAATRDLEERWRALGLQPAALRRRLAASDVPGELARERAPSTRRERDLPARVGRYVVLGELGRGSFGRVLRAHDPRLGRDVAVKILRGDLAEDERTVARFRREGRSAARLSHPGIVPVYEVGEAHGRPYLVTELVAGPSLAEVLADGPVEPRAAARLVAALADALDYAHQLGVVHRDVKPANVLLAPSPDAGVAPSALAGRPLLGDFGLALSEQADATLTREGDVLGTPAYMSPEQARGESVGPATDVYALGAVLRHALCGRPPFEGRPAAVLERVRHAEPLRPRRLRPGLPLDLETVCLVAMAKEPERRYASAGALAADLRRWLAREPVLARRAGPLARAALWCRRNPSQALTVAAALGVVLLVGAVALQRVLAERDRFRAERDAAQANLYRALVGEARAQLEARGTGWRTQGLASLRRAAALEVDDRDAAELRELALRILSARGRSFRPVGELQASTGAPTAVACGPRGRVAASGDAAGHVRLWDVETGALLAERDAHAGAVGGLAFHPRGHRLASTGAGGALRVWDLRADGGADAPSLAALSSVELGAPLGRLRTDPSGRRLVTGATDGRWWLVEGWSAAAPVRPLPPRGGAVIDVALSPDGALAAACAADRTVAVHRVADGGALLVWDTVDPPSTVAFCGATKLAYATPANYGFTWLDATGGRASPHPLLHKGGVARVFGGAGGELVTVASDGALKLWAAASGALEAVATAGHAAAVDVAANARPDRAVDRVVVGHADGSLRAWQVAEPDARRFWSSDHAVDFLPGRRLVRESGLLDLSRGLAGVERGFETPRLRALAALPGARGLVAVASDAGEVRVVDPTAGAIASWRTEAAVTALAPSADGELLATGGGDGGVEVRARATGELRARQEPGVGAVAGLVRLDAERLLVLGASGIAVVGGGAAPRLLTASARPTAATLLAAAERGSAGVVAVGTARGTIELFDADTLAPVRAIPAQGSAVVALAPLVRTQRIVAVTRGGALLVADAASGAPTRLRTTARGASWLVATPDERLLVVGESRPLVLDLEHDRALCHPLVAGGARAAALASDGRTLYLGLAGGTVRRLDLGSSAVRRDGLESEPRNAAIVPTEPTAEIGAHAQRVWGVAASPDGAYVATCDHGGTVQVWDGARRRLLWSREEHEGPAWSVRFDAASRRVASAALDVIVRDAATGAALARLPAGERLTTDVAFLPGGPWLVTGSLDGSVLVWDLERGAVCDVLLRADERVHELALSGDGTRLAAAVHDGRVRVLDLAGFRPRGPAAPPRGPTRILAAEAAPVWAVRWRGDGGLLAAGTADGVVALWETETWTRALALASDSELVRRLAFSADGGLLAASCFNHPVVVWDLEAVGARLTELGVPPPVRLGPSAAVPNGTGAREPR